MVLPCFKVFWFSKDYPTGHSERKNKKRQTEEKVGRQYERVDRNGLKGIVANSSVVPRRPSKVMGWNRIGYFGIFPGYFSKSYLGIHFGYSGYFGKSSYRSTTAMRTASVSPMRFDLLLPVRQTQQSHISLSRNETRRGMFK